MSPSRSCHVWAFGVVLYELLTGTRAFQGESVAETLSHVLTHTPNWALLPAETPAPIRTLLRRCLEKNPKKRLDSAVALRLEIDEALAAPVGVSPADAPQARQRRITWEAIAAVVAASLMAAPGHVGRDAERTARTCVPATVHNHIPTDAADAAHRPRSRSRPFA